MNALFSEEMIYGCIADPDEIRMAKVYGEGRTFQGVDGTITSYLWNGKIYVTDITIKRGR